MSKVRFRISMSLDGFVAGPNQRGFEGGLAASIGDSTLWRWLSEDAIRPWGTSRPDSSARPNFEK